MSIFQRLCGIHPPSWVNRLAYMTSWMPFLLRCLPPGWVTPGEGQTLYSSQLHSQSRGRWSSGRCETCMMCTSVSTPLIYSSPGFWSWETGYQNYMSTSPHPIYTLSQKFMDLYLIECFFLQKLYIITQWHCTNIDWLINSHTFYTCTCIECDRTTISSENMKRLYGIVHTSSQNSQNLWWLLITKCCGPAHGHLADTATHLECPRVAAGQTAEPRSW